MRFYSYLNTAAHILKLYKGERPFASWLKDFFREHKKYGSRDRRQIAQLCYSYFRMGKSVGDMEIKKAIVLALFLSSIGSNEMLQQLDSNLDNIATASIAEKFDLLLTQEGIPWQSVFPFQENLSRQIDHELYTKSLFIQPDLFLRIRPGYENQVREKLKSSQITFHEISEATLSLPNSSKLEDVLKIDQEVVIQDLNSQKSIDPIKDFISLKPKPEIWDCCAASGGKSILLNDLIPQSKLFLSDLRETIIHNLRSRLARAGIKNFQSRVSDASRDLPAHQFDLVICDAPCTGSGTWSRTPEQLFFFDSKKIRQYSELQKRIVLNAGKAVREKGYFLYITCSVFKNENEEVVEFIQQNLPLKLESMQYFKGYENKADTLFAAAFSAAL